MVPEQASPSWREEAGSTWWTVPACPTANAVRLHNSLCFPIVLCPKLTDRSASRRPREMISALAWVPRGAAKPVLDETEPAKDDFDDLAVSLLSAGVGTRIEAPAWFYLTTLVCLPTEIPHCGTRRGGWPGERGRRVRK